MNSHLRKYGVAATIPFELYEVDGVDFRVDAVHAAGDSTRVKDGGAEQNTTNGFADEGKGYSITLTAGEMQAAEIVVYIVDQTATKVWLDKAIIVETYGHAAAMHAMDFDDAVRGGMTALPNAAADAAGGLPISDAGGLDLDDMKTKTDGLNFDGNNVLCDVMAMNTGVITSINFSTGALAADAFAANSLDGKGNWNTVVPDAAGTAPTSAEIKTAIEAGGSSLAQILVDTGTTLPASLPAALTKGTADSGTTTTMVDAARTEADTDYWKDSLIRFTSGTISGQTRLITGFTPASNTITFFPAVTQAVATNTYEILPAAFGNILADWVDGGRLDSLLDAIPTTAMRGTDSASTHDAAAVYTAFGTGGNLTTCATATGFATPTNITAAAGVALSATGGDLIAKTSTFAMAMADANCDELLAGHTTADTVGLVLNEWQDDGRLDLLLDAIKAVTDALTAAAATKLAASAGTVVVDSVDTGYAETTTTLKGGGTASLSAVDDHYNGRIIIFTSGTLQNQATDITDYNGTTKVFTFTAITSAPADGVTFVIV